MGQKIIDGALKVIGLIDSSTTGITVPENPSGNLYAISKKYFTDIITDIEEKVEGKSRTFVISYAQHDLTQSYFTGGGKVYKTDGTEITTWLAFQTYVQYAECGNSYFNSQNAEIDRYQIYILTTEKIVILDDDPNIKTGDMIIVKEIDVPDRWAERVPGQAISWNKMETTKVDLTNYPTLNGNNTFSGTNTFSQNITLEGDQAKLIGHSPTSTQLSTEILLQGGAQALIQTYNALNNQTKFLLRLYTAGAYFGVMPKVVSDSNADLGDSTNKWKDIYLSGVAYLGSELQLDRDGTSGNSKWHIEEDVYSQLVFSRTYNGNKDTMYTMNGSSFLPKLDNTGALGSSSKKFADLFVYKVNKNASNFGLTLPDTTNLTADSEIIDTQSAQSIKGIKTTKEIKFVNNVTSPTGNALSIKNDNGYNAKIQFSDYGFILTGNAVGALKDNATDLGASSYRWKHLYLNGSINFGDNATINKDSSNRINLNVGDGTKVKVGSAETTFKNRVGADADNTYDIGRDTVRWKDAYIAGNLSDGTNSINIANIVGIKEDFSSQISLDNESSLTIFRKECAIIKKGDSIKLHIYISGKNESGASVSGVRFAGSGSYLTLSNTTLADAIKDMNGNALSTSITGQIKPIVQNWYNDGNTTTQTLRMSHQAANQIYLYSAGYSASIPDNANFILSIDEDLAF